MILKLQITMTYAVTFECFTLTHTAASVFFCNWNNYFGLAVLLLILCVQHKNWVRILLLSLRPMNFKYFEKHAVVSI